MTSASRHRKCSYVARANLRYRRLLNLHHWPPRLWPSIAHYIQETGWKARKQRGKRHGLKNNKRKGESRDTCEK